MVAQYQFDLGLVHPSLTCSKGKDITTA
ncbi:hypothetical protein ACNKHQ_13220 [Shigella flexneri]